MSVIILRKTGTVQNLNKEKAKAKEKEKEKEKAKAEVEVEAKNIKLLICPFCSWFIKK